MEVRQIRLEMLESACRAMEMAEQLRETDPLTARALERASLRYWVGGTGMGEPSADTQQDGSGAGARANVRDWRVNRSV